MKTKTINILIIDDSQLVHALLDKVFKEHPDLSIVGKALAGQKGVK